MKNEDIQATARHITNSLLEEAYETIREGKGEPETTYVVQLRTGRGRWEDYFYPPFRDLKTAQDAVQESIKRTKTRLFDTGESVRIVKVEQTVMPLE